MKYSIASVAALLAAGASAHSWLECVDAEVPNMEEYVANPPSPFEWGADKELCHGFPKNIPARPNPPQLAPSDWIDESSNYAYSFDEFEDPNDPETRLACKACQREDRGDAPPAATATPGQTLLMRHWGNGHSTWNPIYANPKGRDPGVIRIYWAGQKDTPLKYFKDLNEANWIPGAQANFSENAITYYADPVSGESPDGRPDQKLMKEHANFFKFTVPEDIETGTHKMVWAWAWKDSMTYDPAVGHAPCDKNTYDNSFELEYGTCFDLVIVDGKDKPSETQKQQQEAHKDDDPKADACSMTCQLGGQVGDEFTCDPTKETCPSCRTPAVNGAPRGCYDACSDFIQGTDCSGADARKIKSRRSHKRRHNHRRHN